MTLKQALETFVETHAGDHEQKYVINYVLGLAPHLSSGGDSHTSSSVHDQRKQEAVEWPERLRRPGLQPSLSKTAMGFTRPT
jgi:hypothetical protein